MFGVLVQREGNCFIKQQAMESTVSRSRYRLRDDVVTRPRYRLGDGIVGGIIAGIVMAIICMGGSLLMGQNALYPLAAIGHAFMPHNETPDMSTSIILKGLLLHMSMSIVTGAIFCGIANLFRLRNGLWFWGLLYAAAVWGIAAYGVLDAVNPTLKYEYNQMLFLAGHLGYGIVLGSYVGSQYRVVDTDRVITRRHNYNAVVGPRVKTRSTTTVVNRDGVLEGDALLNKNQEVRDDIFADHVNKDDDKVVLKKDRVVVDDELVKDRTLNEDKLAGTEDKDRLRIRKEKVITKDRDVFHESPEYTDYE